MTSTSLGVSLGTESEVRDDEPAAVYGDLRVLICTIWPRCNEGSCECRGWGAAQSPPEPR